MTKSWSPLTAAVVGLMGIIFIATLIVLVFGKNNMSIFGGIFVALGAVAEIIARVYEEKGLRERTVVGRVLCNDCIVEAKITEGKKQKISDFCHEMGLALLGAGGLLVGFGPIL